METPEIKAYVAIYKPSDLLVLIHESEYCATVEFPFNIVYNKAELGGDACFEYIGEY